MSSINFSYNLNFSSFVMLFLLLQLVAFAVLQYLAKWFPAGKDRNTSILFGSFFTFWLSIIVSPAKQILANIDDPISQKFYVKGYPFKPLKYYEQLLSDELIFLLGPMILNYLTITILIAIIFHFLAIDIFRKSNGIIVLLIWNLTAFCIFYIYH